jgi:hypothetical protein
MLLNRIKKIIIPPLTIALLCYTSSCQKDDICVDNDTPLLVIGFFDVEDTATAKSVTALRIRALGFDTSPTTFQDRADLDSIAIPLQTNTTSTQFVFISDSADNDDGIETGTIDTLTFNYSVQEEFVSRACGFVARYRNLDTTRQVFTTDWIKGIDILNDTIENSAAIHVKIFH